MRLNWKTNKIQPIPDRSWHTKNKQNANWWNVYVISKKYDFIGLMNFEEEYKDENGDPLSEACVTADGNSMFKILWTDVDYWLYEQELQTFLLNSVN